MGLPDKLLENTILFTFLVTAKSWELELKRPLRKLGCIDQHCVRCLQHSRSEFLFTSRSTSCTGKQWARNNWNCTRRKTGRCPIYKWLANIHQSLQLTLGCSILESQVLSVLPCNWLDTVLLHQSGCFLSLRWWLKKCIFLPYNHVVWFMRNITNRPFASSLGLSFKASLRVSRYKYRFSFTSSQTH